MRTALPLCLLASVVLADVGTRQGGVYIGPARDIDCAADGGLLCTRDAGVAIARLRCNGATATEAGCVTPNDQSWAGKKTLTDRERIVCKAHASLTACSSGEKGTWQSCCDHNAPVYCDGTTNRELVGPAADEKVLGVVHVNGIPVSLMGGAFTLQTAATVTALEGSWGSGSTSDGGTVLFRLTDGTNLCDCTVPCGAPTTRTSCSGSCAYAAGVTVTPTRNSTTCAINPYVGGDLLVKGVQ
jgi:hypothetical protein